MHNKVVYRIARGLRRAGAVVLRFNYRGVNLSEGQYDHGIGEVEDARAALALLRSRYPELPFSLAGFSFGSRIILKLGCETPARFQADRRRISSQLVRQPVARALSYPRVFIVSTHDQFCAVPAMEAYFAALPEPKELIWVDATDHFFTGALDEFENVFTARIWALTRSVAHFALDFAGGPLADQIGDFGQQPRNILRLYQRPNLLLRLGVR